jgi:hypothetical protein
LESMVPGSLLLKNLPLKRRLPITPLIICLQKQNPVQGVNPL